jgi:hypothetical protein
MLAFEDIKPGARLRGLDPTGIAEVVQVARFGPDALNLVFRVDGRVGERLVYRGEESGFEFLETGRSYAFDADGGLLRLASEAYRIQLAVMPPTAVLVRAAEALDQLRRDAAEDRGARRSWRCVTTRRTSANRLDKPFDRIFILDT